MNANERKEMFKKTFDLVAPGYDSKATRFFTESLTHLVPHLNLKGDENILDVATGTGNAALKLACKLPHGQVRAIDFSTSMLAKAEQKKNALAIDNVQFIEMDMQSIQFPNGYFDMAVCCYGIFFAEDMVGQVGHMAHKVKPKGKIAITTFYQNLFSPQTDLFLDRIERYGVNIPPLSWKRTNTKEKCRNLFQEAGLVNIATYQQDVGYYLTQPEQWWDILWNAGYRGLIDQLNDKDLEAFKKAHLKEVAALADPKGLWLEIDALFTIGTKR